MDKQAHKPEFFPLLPPGFHHLTPKQVASLCVDGFPDSIVRPDIMAGLLTILGHVREVGLLGEIWLNGSFTTQKGEPDDVDFVIFAPTSLLETADPLLDAFIEWLNDKNDEPKEIFKCHTQIIFEGMATEYANDLVAATRAHWQDHFGFSVTSREPKGIVVLNLVEDPEEVSEEELSVDSHEGGTR